MYDDLNVRFWGTRGSIPVPGPHTTKYGGNTTCLELRYGETLVVIDAGSGIRQLGRSVSQKQSNPIHLLFTHTHWDHIQGLPFFAPAYIGSNKLLVYGSDEPECLLDTMGGQMRAPYFPVPFAAMAKRLDFHRVCSEFELGRIRVRTVPLPHPGGCLGYRFEVDGQSLVFATDCELDNLGADSGSAKRLWHADSNLFSFFESADTIVIDCQYTDAEYQQKVGWGHNSISTIVDLCCGMSPETVVLFHHDPESDDAKVDAMVRSANAQLYQRSHFDTKVVAAREGSLLSAKSARRERMRMAS